MDHQQRLEAIEKAFAEQANNMDRFIVEEEKKVAFFVWEIGFVFNLKIRDPILLQRLQRWSLSSSLAFPMEKICSTSSARLRLKLERFDCCFCAIFVFLVVFQAGLQVNRFTHHTVLSLEERWKKFVTSVTARFQQLQNPPRK